MFTPSSSVIHMVLILLMALLKAASTETFHRAGEIYYGNELANIRDRGKLLTLSLDNSTGSGYQSKNNFLFGRFDMNIKLVPGNSAGTVATFYLSSQGANHNEIDFEFLGNVSGQPYTIHTNIFSHGIGNREQQFRVWFDLTASFHKYSVIWNPQRIILMVDDTPIRVFNNNEAIGVPFLNNQAMTVYATIWDGESWVTEGGRIKTDWTQAPFTTSYKSFVINACKYSSGSSSCGSSETTNSVTEASLTQSLDSKEKEKLLWVQENCMIYDYCTDYKRFPQGLPPECNQPYYLQ